MRRAANDMLKSLKDQVRGVRYSIRAEAEEPGSLLPKALHDLKPVVAMGGPALRLADGLFTEVESLATELLAPPENAAAFPLPVLAYLDRDVSLSSVLYAPFKAILAEKGVRACLVSERALDHAGDGFRDRQADLIPRGRSMSTHEVALACGTLIRALVEARPVRKVTFGSGESCNPNVMLSPNLYCAVIIGISAGILTLHPDLSTDGRAVLESAESVAGVRFHRFSRALMSRAPEIEIAKELEILLPFLP